jgi:hypothetical protein
VLLQIGDAFGVWSWRRRWWSWLLPREAVLKVLKVLNPEVFALVAGAIRVAFAFNTVELSVGFRGHSLSPSAMGSVSVSTLSTLSTGV